MSNGLPNIDKMSELEFAKLFRYLRDDIEKDPINNFIRNSNFINFDPTPGQLVLLKLVFGIPLDSKTKHKVRMEEIEAKNPNEFGLEWIEITEVELYKYFTGFDYSFTGKKYNKINEIVGRRGGKTSIAAILSIYFSIITNWKPYLKKTPFASVVVLSHTVTFSQEVLDLVKSLILESAILSRLQDRDSRDTQSEFYLKVPFLQDDNKTIIYSRISIKVGAASKRTTRGRAVCVLIADEISHWNTSIDCKETDVEIFRAIRPALGQFADKAAIFKLSSPAGKMGLLYEEWERREELKDDIIQLQAPSWTMNNIVPDEVFKSDFKEDPDGFDTEYRAKFAESLSNFIQPEFLDMCVLKGTTFIPPAKGLATTYEAVIDAAFKNDRFAFTIVGHDDKRITQYCVKKWEGTKGNPVQAFEVAKHISAICKKFKINKVYADQYAFQPLKEIFRVYDLVLEEKPFTQAFKKKIFFSLKRAIHNSILDLLDEPIQIKEIKHLQVEQASAGQIRIGHPVGGHDDLACALAIAVHIALEKSGSGQVNFLDKSDTYTQPVDKTGKSFTAPNVDTLKNMPGMENLKDNTDLWIKDKLTGELRHISELENKDDEDEDGFKFSF
jgi:hypothetical protein